MAANKAGGGPGQAAQLFFSHQVCAHPHDIVTTPELFLQNCKKSKKEAQVAMVDASVSGVFFCEKRVRYCRILSCQHLLYGHYTAPYIPRVCGELMNQVYISD
jgi:hypothetical protein